MFKWISSLFVTAEAKPAPAQKLSAVQPERLAPKKREPVLTEVKVKKEKAQKLSNIEKTVTKNGVGFAPKIEPVFTEVKKVSAKVKTEKVTKASLSKLTKVKLEEFALATYGVDIDRRKKKEDLVKEVLKLSKKV